MQPKIEWRQTEKFGPKSNNQPQDIFFFPNLKFHNRIEGFLLSLGADWFLCWCWDDVTFHYQFEMGFSKSAIKGHGPKASSLLIRFQRMIFCFIHLWCASKTKVTWEHPSLLLAGRYISTKWNYWIRSGECDSTCQA